MLSVQELNDKSLDLASNENIGDGDHATLCYIPDDAMGECKLLIKKEGILTGANTVREVFHRSDPSLEVGIHIPDDMHVHPDDIVLTVKGCKQNPLQTKRLVLGILQRMSGTTTMTYRYQQVSIETGTKTRVLDIRKTTPGIRMLEEGAVEIDGGMNHRIGLFDMILLKDNHIDSYGGVHNTIPRVRRYCKERGKSLKIEYEVHNSQELGKALAGGCDRIMLDNFTPDQTRQAVEKANGRYEAKSSGGTTFGTMIPYAKAGVDFVSFGALTHSVKSLDMNLKAADSNKLKI